MPFNSTTAVFCDVSLPPCVVHEDSSRFHISRQVFMLAAGAEPELHAKTKMEIFVACCPPEFLG